MHVEMRELLQLSFVMVRCAASPRQRLCPLASWIYTCSGAFIYYNVSRSRRRHTAYRRPTLPPSSLAFVRTVISQLPWRIGNCTYQTSFRMPSTGECRVNTRRIHYRHARAWPTVFHARREYSKHLYYMCSTVGVLLVVVSKSTTKKSRKTYLQLHRPVTIPDNATSGGRNN